MTDAAISKKHFKRQSIFASWSLSGKKQVIEYREQGEKLYSVILSILAEAGGLFGAVKGALMYVENFFTWREMRNKMSKRLYTARKVDYNGRQKGLNTRKSSIKSDLTIHKDLIKKIRNGNFKKDEADKIIEELTETRLPVKQFLKEQAGLLTKAKRKFRTLIWIVLTFIPGIKKMAELKLQKHEDHMTLA